jgi:glycosyltransferase involved in cell wall biosynthesis
MGRFERRKAQLSIIQAFQTIASRHRNAQLVLVGDDGTAYANLVRRMAEESALGDQLRLEKVTSDSLVWYRAADVLLSASDIESMPRSAFEAMALGSPVLAAAVYGVPELIEDGVTGWLFPERDIDALAEGIDRALSTSPDELARMGARASERVRAEHDSAGYAAAYRDMLQRLMAERIDPTSKPLPQRGD